MELAPRLTIVIDWLALPMVMVKFDVDTVAVEESVTAILKVALPMRVGVPEMTPLEESIERPVGSEPLVTANELPPEPPEVEIDSVKGALYVPFRPVLGVVIARVEAHKA